jgi:hypothetical protein
VLVSAYANRRLLDTTATLEKIDAIAPAVGDEIATRYPTNKIYTAKAVAKAYPQLERALVRDGSEADLGGLVADAWGGLRVRRRARQETREAAGADPGSGRGTAVKASDTSQRYRL